MSKRDYYEVLGVGKNADSKDIKQAYRRVAMKYHPDRNPEGADAPDRFKEASEAYEILSDREKRNAYDQFGHAGVNPQVGRNGGFSGNFSDIFGDVFGDIFGSGGRQRGGPQRGSDLRYTLEISLEDAVRGAAVKIRVPTLVSCKTCAGSGAKAGSAPSTCGTCNGAGQVRMQQGFFQVQQTCPTCRGKGRVITDPCAGCRGAGRVEEVKTLSVKVPPGVDNGDRIRLSGEGEAGPQGGTAGDLYVQMSVKKHSIFERDGAHLYCGAPITVTHAALGGELEVPTLEGRVKLRIPPGTQTGKLFRLRGRGVKPVRGGATGDLLCRVEVETPVNLTKRQKKLLEEFQETLDESGNQNSPRQSRWFAGVKNFFEDMKI